MYVVILLKRAKKALESTQGATKERVVKRLEGLKDDPYSEKQLVSKKARSLESATIEYFSTYALPITKL